MHVDDLVHQLHVRYPTFHHADLISLPNCHMCVKLLVDGMPTEPFSAQTLPPID
jgi:hypothetical protein